jgi:hypothetical protein
VARAARAGLAVALIVGVVGFLDRQSQELMAGLGVLVGGPAPQNGPTTAPPVPSLPDGPGELLPPAEPYQPPPPVTPPGGGTPMPRSTPCTRASSPTTPVLVIQTAVVPA